jgi:hypothetical protein
MRHPPFSACGRILSHQLRAVFLDFSCDRLRFCDDRAHQIVLSEGSSDPKSIVEMQTFSGRTIDVDVHCRQEGLGAPLAETMQIKALIQMEDFHIVDGAGHWAHPCDWK